MSEAEEHLLRHLHEAVKAFTCAIDGLAEQTKIQTEFLRSRFNLATLKDLQEMEKRIMASQAEIDAALSKIDAATTKIAANVDVIATTDQQISDEIDKFLAGAPVGSVITDTQVATLKAVADKAQASSDASDAQVEVLKAIAAKGAGNPVPVPVPPTPPV